MTKTELSSYTQRENDSHATFPTQTRGSFSKQGAKQTKASKLSISIAGFERPSKDSLQQGQLKFDSVH